MEAYWDLPGVEGKKVIVRGFWKRRLLQCKFFQERWCHHRGYRQYEGAIYNENGLDYEAVFNHRKNRCHPNFGCHQYGKDQRYPEQLDILITNTQM